MVAGDRETSSVIWHGVYMQLHVGVCRWGLRLLGASLGSADVPSYYIKMGAGFRLPSALLR